jgi:hypothetical protein
MLILVMMLFIGLFAGVWGFMACFFPEQWDRLTESISFADRWSVAGPRRRHPLMRVGQCAGGLVTCAVGCWFAYIAVSEIYLVLTGRATTHTLPPTSGTIPNAPTPQNPIWPQGPTPVVNPPVEMPDIPWYKSVPLKLLELFDILKGGAGDFFFVVDPCLTTPSLRCGPYAPPPPA